jgi:hypothetical protein
MSAILLGSTVSRSNKRAARRSSAVRCVSSKWCLSRVLVKTRILLNQGIHTGHGDQDPDGPTRQSFGPGKLVQVTGIVVVN